MAKIGGLKVSYKLPETIEVPKTLADETKKVKQGVNGGYQGGDIKVGLKAEAKSVSKSIKQASGVLGKIKKNWKKPGKRGIKGL